MQKISSLCIPLTPSQGKGFMRVQNPNPYPYPHVPYPRPLGVLKPLTNPSHTPQMVCLRYSSFLINLRFQISISNPRYYPKLDASGWSTSHQPKLWLLLVGGFRCKEIFWDQDDINKNIQYFPPDPSGTDQIWSDLLENIQYFPPDPSGTGRNQSELVRFRSDLTSFKWQQVISQRQIIYIISILIISCV